LNIETVIPCGLIINELISNSLKYAFPNRNGELKISLKSKEDNYELIISDNGIGFPEELDFKNTDSLGLQLVNTLTNQIDSKITLDSRYGTKFIIILKS
jgi:two-component sensor histidine kinase